MEYAVANQLKMSVGECMRNHTHRQMLGWKEWIKNQDNNPSRTDYYIMRIGVEIARILARDPDSITLENFKINFVDPVEEAERKKKLAIEKIKTTKNRWREKIALDAESQSPHIRPG